MGDSGRVDSVHRLPFIARLDLYTVVEVAWGKCAVGAPASVKREPALSCKGSARGTVRGRIGCPRCMVGCARARRDHRSGIPPRPSPPLAQARHRSAFGHHHVVYSSGHPARGQGCLPHLPYPNDVNHGVKNQMCRFDPRPLRVDTLRHTRHSSSVIVKNVRSRLSHPSSAYINVVGVFPWARGQVLGLCRCPPDPSHEQHRLQLVRQSVVPCFPATMCEAYHRG
jgi:hypothetical protein